MSTRGPCVIFNGSQFVRLAGLDFKFGNITNSVVPSVMFFAPGCSEIYNWCLVTKIKS